MKKILTLLCTGLMAFSLVGCSKKTEETVEEPKTVVESGPVVEEKKTEEKEEEIKKAEDELMQRKMDAGTFKLSDLKDKKDE